MRGTVVGLLGINTDAIACVLQCLSLVIKTASLACPWQLMQRDIRNSLLKQFCEKSPIIRTSTTRGVKWDDKDLRSIAFDQVDPDFQQFLKFRLHFMWSGSLNVLAYLYYDSCNRISARSQKKRLEIFREKLKLLCQSPSKSVRILFSFILRAM